MKHNFKKLWFIPLLVLVLIFAVACDSGNNDEYPSKEIPTETQAEPPTQSHEHTYSEEFAFNEEAHWYPAICGHGDLEKDKQGHQFGEPRPDDNYANEHGFTCAVCGYTKSSYFDYTLSEDQTYYILSRAYIYKETDVTIPAEHEGLPVKEIGSGAFSRRTRVTGIKIPSTVEKIGESAFYNCAQLAKLELPEGVKEIGPYAFNDCASLRELIIPGSVKVTNTWFNGKSGIETLTLSDGVEAIEGLFGEENASIKTVIVPDSVTLISAMSFRFCRSLESVTLGNITEVKEMTFEGCHSLKEIVIPEGVTVIEATAFSDCTSLKTITLPSTVETINAGFLYCTGLEGIYVPSLEMWMNLYFSSINVSDNPLYYAHNLYIDGELLTDLVIEAGRKSEYGAFIPAFQFAGASCIQTVTINGEANITTIEKRAFYGCSGIEKIEIPETVTTMEEYVFEACTALKEIVLLGENRWGTRAAYYGQDGYGESFEGLTATKAAEYLTGEKAQYIWDRQ